MQGQVTSNFDTSKSDFFMNGWKNEVNMGTMRASGAVYRINGSCASPVSFIHIKSLEEKSGN